MSLHWISNVLTRAMLPISPPRLWILWWRKRNIFHLQSSTQSMFSQPWHYGHLGLDNVVLLVSILCAMGCLSVSLASTIRFQDHHSFHLWPPKKSAGLQTSSDLPQRAKSWAGSPWTSMHEYIRVLLSSRWPSLQSFLCWGSLLSIPHPSQLLVWCLSWIYMTPFRDLGFQGFRNTVTPASAWKTMGLHILLGYRHTFLI